MLTPNLRLCVRQKKPRGAFGRMHERDRRHSELMERAVLYKEQSMRTLVPALLLTSSVALSSSSGLAASPLGSDDIPRILTAENGFDQTYKGRLFTARMTVSDVVQRSGVVSVGLNKDNSDETFPPISCNLEDLNEVGLARKGRILWVSGIVDQRMGSTIFLEPCQISLTQEPLTVPRTWKTHPLRQ